ncbi:lysostaphin resistance A-like protein [Kineococcus gynurae]|uniref:Lysostaphin resistance A-like protein n=1 Tax=Kineococcus gynurae TaxID=452979 RepID=A0ABV5LMW7_9ACTN
MTITTPRPTTGLSVVLGHHLVAGLAVLLPWLLLLTALPRAGGPPVAFLLLVVGLVLPVVATLLLRHRLRVEGLLTRRGPTPTDRARIRARLGLVRPARGQGLRLGLTALLAGMVLPVVGLPVEDVLRRLGWFSAWPSAGVPATGGTEHRASLLVLWVLVAVLLGPVVEEVLFRGLLQPLLPGGLWGRVVGGSALFAAYHLWQPAAWVTVWAATLPLAWLRERTGSTWPSVGVHVTVNALALGLLLVGGLDR